MHTIKIIRVLITFNSFENLVSGICESCTDQDKNVHHFYAWKSGACLAAERAGWCCSVSVNLLIPAHYPYIPTATSLLHHLLHPAWNSFSSTSDSFHPCSLPWPLRVGGLLGDTRHQTRTLTLDSPITTAGPRLQQRAYFSVGV